MSEIPFPRTPNLGHGPSALHLHREVGAQDLRECEVEGLAQRLEVGRVHAVGGVAAAELHEHGDELRVVMEPGHRTTCDCDGPTLCHSHALTPGASEDCDKFLVQHDGRL